MAKRTESRTKSRNEVVPKKLAAGHRRFVVKSSAKTARSVRKLPTLKSNITEGN